MFKKQKKIHIKQMFVYKEKEKDCLYNIAILTDDFQLHQFEFMSYKKYNLVTQAAARLRKLFLPYELDHASDVSVLECIKDFKDPMFIYFSILQPHIQFNFRQVNIEKILNRIISYHHSFAAGYKKNNKVNRVKRTFYKSLWDSLVATEKCPWISRQIDEDLDMTSPANKKRQILVRLGAYYMVIKEYKMTTNRKVALRKALREKKAAELVSQQENEEFEEQ